MSFSKSMLPEGAKDMHVEGDLGLDLAFSQAGPGRGRAVVLTLERIAQVIEGEVFPTLEPFLGA